MTFGGAVSSCFRKYATFRGRASRAEYWWFVLFELLVFGAAAILGGITGSSELTTFLLPASILVFVLPSLAVTVRRLHDTGRSGWLYLIALIPFGGIVLLVFTATAGEPGSNFYGPEP